MAKGKRSTESRKQARAASWARGQERKKARVEEQKRRESENQSLRAAGQPTPWEVAKARRTERRRQDSAA